MREGQADNLLLDRDRYLGFNRRLPAAMCERAAIQQAGEAIAAKPLQITPEALIGDARGLALLEEGTPTLEDGAE